jgi:adenosylcobinamide-phosphate synthase
MSFFAILFALLIEQVRPLARANPIHSALRSWARWVAGNFDAGKQHHGWVAWGLAVPGPALAALAVHILLVVYAGWVFAMLWSVAVLYVTLGFRQFSHHFTNIRDALDAGDEASARQLLAQWQQVDASELPRSEIVRHVIEYSVLAAHRHVFGVLAWFSVLAAFGLGPAGAVLYRMSEFVYRYWHNTAKTAEHPVSPALLSVATRAWAAIDWLPSRLTALGFAVVGSFEEAIDCWRGERAPGRRGAQGHGVRAQPDRRLRHGRDAAGSDHGQQREHARARGRGRPSAQHRRPGLALRRAVDGAAGPADAGAPARLIAFGLRQLGEQLAVDLVPALRHGVRAVG